MDFLSPHEPNQSKNTLGVSFSLALLAHGILFVLLFVSMQWRSSPTAPVYAELWVPEADQPAESKPAEEAPPPEPAPEPPPAPQEPAKTPPPQGGLSRPLAQTDLDRQTNLLEDPDIVQERLDREVKKQEEEKQRILEQERRLKEAQRAEERRKAEEARRLEEERQAAEEAKRQEEERKALEAQKAAEAKKAAEEQARKEAQQRREEAEKKAQEELRRQAQEREKKLAEEKARRQQEEQAKKAEQAQKAAELAAAVQRRKDMLNRLSGQSSAAAAASGGGGMTSFQQARYVNSITACIRPHLIFSTPPGTRRGDYVASFEVRLLRNGSQASPPRLLKSSKLRAFDNAVEKAILMCDPFPKPPVGEVPSSIVLTFDPVEDAR